MAYNLSTGFAIYFVLWWLVLFLTLPFGVRSQHEDGEGAPGTDPGAPVMAQDGTQADLDHADLGHDLRCRDVGLLSGLFQHRAAVEADGHAVLKAKQRKWLPLPGSKNSIPATGLPV